MYLVSSHRIRYALDIISAFYVDSYTALVFALASSFYIFVIFSYGISYFIFTSSVYVRYVIVHVEIHFAPSFRRSTRPMTIVDRSTSSKYVRCTRCASPYSSISNSRHTCRVKISPFWRPSDFLDSRECWELVGIALFVSSSAFCPTKGFFFSLIIRRPLMKERYFESFWIRTSASAVFVPLTHLLRSCGGIVTRLEIAHLPPSIRKQLLSFLGYVLLK